MFFFFQIWSITIMIWIVAHNDFAAKKFVKTGKM